MQLQGRKRGGCGGRGGRQAVGGGGGVPGTGVCPAVPEWGILPGHLDGKSENVLMFLNRMGEEQRAVWTVRTRKMPERWSGVHADGGRPPALPPH